MQFNWRDITYLARGNPRQQRAHATLRRLGVFDILRAYDPVLVGTIPIDLDIICAVNDPLAFEREVTAAFGACECFRVEHKTIKDVPRVVADFFFAGFPIQVFGQPRAVEEQNGYRHMLIEARLLEIGGDPARDGIRRLKRAGLKTEPAFARCFGLEGDPYVALLELVSLSEDELRRTAGRGG